jgi:hypothetical protein
MSNRTHYRVSTVAVSSGLGIRTKEAEKECCSQTEVLTYLGRLPAELLRLDNGLVIGYAGDCPRQKQHI